MSKFVNTLGTQSRAYEINIKDFHFVSLEDLHKKGESTIHQINGAYLQRGKQDFKDRVVLINIAEKSLYALPPHLTDKTIVLCSDPEIVEEVKSGKCGFKVYSYESHNRICYSVNFVEF